MLPMIAGFAVLIGVLTTILKYHSTNEITALRASGLSQRALFYPLLAASLLFSSFALINYQWIYPKASEFLLKVKKKRSPHLSAIESLPLKSGSHLIYKEMLHDHLIDAYLIQKETLFHCRSINLEGPIPTGYFVDQFSRGKEGELTHQSSQKTMELAQLKGVKELALKALHPESLSLSKLTQRPGPAFGKNLSQTYGLHLHSKLLLAALAPLAALLTAAMLSFRSRLGSSTRAYAFAMTSYVIYILILNSGIFLLFSFAGTPILSPWLLALPILPLFFLFKRVAK